MKRQIKFRGKRVDTGEWVIGCLVGYHQAYYDGNSNRVCIDSGILTTTEVISDTVGQFTGLLDKNGKEIYEGDIVMWGHLKDGRSDETPPRIAIVKLFPSLHFLAVTKTEFGTPYAFHYGCFAYQNTDKYLEIIGNIHDNPELRKGGKE